MKERGEEEGETNFINETHGRRNNPPNKIMYGTTKCPIISLLDKAYFFHCESRIEDAKH